MKKKKNDAQYVISKNMRKSTEHMFLNKINYCSLFIIA